MAMIYQVQEITEKVANFAQVNSDLVIARALASLTERSVELTAHWSKLEPEIQVLEASHYYAELAKVCELQRLYVDNLAHVINQREIAARDKMDAENSASGGGEMVPPPANVPYAEFHMKFELFSTLPPMTSVSVGKLKLLKSGVRELVDFMAKNNAHGMISDYVLTSLVQSKLDFSSRVSFTLWFRGNERPTIEQVIAYFDYLIEAMAPQASPSNDDQQPSTSAATAQSPGPVRKNMRALCAHCGVKHQLHRCAQFKTATYNARCKTLNRSKLCYNCFSQGHTATECTDGPCERCNKKHNSIMCRTNWDNE